MSTGIYTSSLGKVLNWARSRSLWYLSVNAGACCADEVLNTQGCRYDFERFGCVPQLDPKQADLLIVSGVVTKKSAPFLRDVYDAMPDPKYVLAVGACAACGGLFQESDSVVSGVNEVIPVDIYVSGCPPRPEAIMNGLISLQEKINGIENQRTQI